MVVLASTGLALALIPATGSDAAPRGKTPESIVALGDSYLAGIGAGNYRIESGCRRSSDSPAAQVSRAIGARLVDRTCPGSSIRDAAAQADILTADADLVIVQAGGNDLGFVSIALACLLGTEERCREQTRAAGARLAGIESRMVDLVRQIRLRAPAATVWVLGYPRLLESVRRCSPLLSADRVRGAVRLQDALDSVLSTAARRTGARFVDWPRVVDRHSLCSADPWFALPGARWDDLLHPDRRAAAAMADRLRREAAA